MSAAWIRAVNAAVASSAPALLRACGKGARLIGAV